MKTTIKTGIAALMLLAISCIKEPLRSPQAVNTQTQDNAAAQTTGHYIGERFGGGIVFWLDSKGQHGLIADTVDLGLFTWWNYAYIHTGAQTTTIGSGKTNTQKIVSAQGKTRSYAALACTKSQRSGYNDWFLPSKDELNELYKQKDVVGGFAGNVYWSSSEGSNYFAWYQNFYYGGQFNYYKSFTDYVRAVRAF